MPKRKCTFTEGLKEDYPFLKKVFVSSGDRVECTQCKSEFSVGYGGRADIKKHLQTTKHKSSLLAAASSSKTHIIKITKGTDRELIVAAKEATFAYHTAIHGLSFKTSDCTSKLVSNLFETKFSVGRTKCEAIVVNVFAPMCIEELHEELSESKFVCITIDISTKKDIKIVSVIVRYFLPQAGVKVKLLDFHPVCGEDSDAITGHLFSVIDKHQLTKKIIGFCSENCNTNFEGLKSKDENDVFSRLKQVIGRNIIEVECAARVVHNCIQNAVDVLPFDIEAVVVKICKYFYIYTVRTAELKEFSDFVDVEYKKVLQHGNTRFLSLLPAVEKILRMFEGLKSYFNSQENCPLIIKTLFDEPCGEIYLWFIHGQLTLFNKCVTKMEKANICAAEVASELKTLQIHLQERRATRFIPQKAKLLLKKLEDTQNVNSQAFFEEVDDFYGRCLSYIELCEKSFEEAVFHTWVNTEFTWPDVESTAEIINEKYEQSLIDIDSLFDEVIFAQQYMFDCERKKEWEDKRASCEKKWVELFNHFYDNNISVVNLMLVVEFVFSLPGTSASVERLFSIMNNVWSLDRSLLSESTVQALLFCKVNIDLTCLEFYEKIKNEEKILRKVLSSEKYKWYKKIK